MFVLFYTFRNRYIAFVKNAAFQFQQLRIKKMKEEQEAEQVCFGFHILPIERFLILFSYLKNLLPGYAIHCDSGI